MQIGLNEKHVNLFSSGRQFKRLCNAVWLIELPSLRGVLSEATGLEPNPLWPNPRSSIHYSFTLNDTSQIYKHTQRYGMWGNKKKHDGLNACSVLNGDCSCRLLSRFMSKALSKSVSGNRKLPDLGSLRKAASLNHGRPLMDWMHCNYSNELGKL